jgi:sulfur carrier protein ThiS
MAVQILLNATLRGYVPDYDPYAGVRREVAPGTTVAQVLADLGVPAEEVTLIFVDGRRQEPDYSLRGAERIGLFPPIGGG